MSGCETPMTWQGPRGSTDQQMAQARYECNQDVEADRARMMQIATQQNNPYLALTLPGRAGEMFNLCMEAKGFRLVQQQ